MPDDNPAVLECMFSYLYSFDYDDTSENFILQEASELSDLERQLLCNVQVYAIAEKYEVPALKRLARCKLKSLLLDERKPNQQNYIDAAELTHLSVIIDEVFNSTPETDTGLRDVVAKYCASNTNQDSIQNPKWTELLHQHSDLAVGILRAILERETHAGEATGRILAREDTKQRILRLKLAAVKSSLCRLHNRLNYPLGNAEIMARFGRRDVEILQERILAIWRGVDAGG